MRKSKEATAATRATIVVEAARLFREKGFDAVGVDAIMEAAGLTHGGFYGHFRTKDELVAEAVEAGLAANRVAGARHATLGEQIAAYLDPIHRDAVGAGCCVAALGSDVARGDASLRTSLTAHLRAEITRLAALVRGRSAARRRRQAIATYAALVGALTLARAVDDVALSDEILAAVRAELAPNGPRAPAAEPADGCRSADCRRAPPFVGCGARMGRTG